MIFTSSHHFLSFPSTCFFPIHILHFLYTNWSVLFDVMQCIFFYIHFRPLQPFSIDFSRQCVRIAYATEMNSIGKFPFVITVEVWNKNRDEWAEHECVRCASGWREHINFRNGLYLNWDKGRLWRSNEKKIDVRSLWILYINFHFSLVLD